MGFNIKVPITRLKEGHHGLDLPIWNLMKDIIDYWTESRNGFLLEGPNIVNYLYGLQLPWSSLHIKLPSSSDLCIYIYIPSSIKVY